MAKNKIAEKCFDTETDLIPNGYCEIEFSLNGKNLELLHLILNDKEFATSDCVTYEDDVFVLNTYIAAPENKLSISLLAGTENQNVDFKLIFKIKNADKQVIFILKDDKGNPYYKGKLVHSTDLLKYKDVIRFNSLPLIVNNVN